MSQLKQLQAQMFALLQQTDEPEADFLASNPNIKAPLKVYRGSILGNHLEALRDIYPVVDKLVGETFFDFMFLHFYRQHQNTHFDVSCYGGELARFIEDFEPCQSLPYLPDVARLEWRCHQACLAPVPPTPDWEQLMQLSEEQLQKVVFALCPGSHLLSSEYPVVKIFEVNQVGFQGDEKIDLDKEQGDRVFIWQSGLDLHIEPVSEQEHCLVKGVQSQQTLEKIIYDLTKEFGLDEQQCQGLLAKMIQKGWLVGFTVLEYP